MIVEITSCAPVVAFRKPAIPAHAAPASIATTIASTTWTIGVSPESEEPIQTAKNEPTRYWPWPPMLNMPQRNAKATARPVRISGVVIRSVCWRLSRRGDALVRPTPTGSSQLRPEPSKIAR